MADKNYPEVTNEALPSLYPWTLRRGASYLHKILTLWYECTDVKSKPSSHAPNNSTEELGLRPPKTKFRR